MLPRDSAFGPSTVTILVNGPWKQLFVLKIGAVTGGNANNSVSHKFPQQAVRKILLLKRKTFCIAGLMPGALLAVARTAA